MRIINSNTKKHTSKRVFVDDDIFNLIKDKNIWSHMSRGKVDVVIIQSPRGKDAQSLARFIMNPKKGMYVDHINNNPLDNRRKNLRVCTNAQNLRNRPRQANNKSGAPSVRKRGNRWEVRIKYLYTSIYLGLFKSFNEAVYIRDQAILQLHGDFARTYLI